MEASGAQDFPPSRVHTMRGSPLCGAESGAALSVLMASRTPLLGVLIPSVSRFFFFFFFDSVRIQVKEGRKKNNVRFDLVC